MASQPSDEERSTSPSQLTRRDEWRPANKRRRIPLACSNCRHRKSRCDGARPKCSLCRELGCECLYEQAGTTTNLTVGRSYISRLETRLEEIESNIKHLQQAQPAGKTQSPSTALSQHGPSLLPENKDSSTRDGSAMPNVPTHLLYPNNAEIGEMDTAEDSIDGMGAIKFTDEEDYGYFGPSSNIAFLRHISLAMARNNTGNPTIPSPSHRAPVVAGTMSVSRTHHAQDDISGRGLNLPNGRVNIYALPSEARTWSLIKEYFQKTGQLLPFVHEESFCETYFQMKRNNFTMVRRTWLGLLNIILAMAATLSVEGNIPSEKRIEESDVYYQRANALCDKESRRNISLELVQYLLIAGQYLQGTQKSVQAWTVHGLAITTAFQLGLQSPRTNADFAAPECEIRKRVWFGCILLDRTLSMTFGRPSIIPDSYVKLDLPVSNIQIVGQTPQTDPAPQMDAMCFTATIQLYNVMYQIIDTCYGQNLGLEEFPQNSDIFTLVLKGQRQLDEWRHQIVPQLFLRVSDTPLGLQDLDQMEATNLIIERFNLVISLRYHNLRILLHRRILENFLDSYGGFPLDGGGTNGAENIMLQRIGISSVETCVESAMVIISIVHTVVMSTGWRRDLLGAWNYSLFYTFNAGLVLFAALLVSPKDTTGDPKQSTSASRWDFVERSPHFFNMAIEALRNLDQGNRVVERCVDYLSQLPSTIVVGQNEAAANGGPDAAAAAAAAYNSLGNPSTTSTYPVNSELAMNNNVSLGQNPIAGRMPNANATTMTMTTPRHGVPMDIDLNEFMLDTDLDLFARYFDGGGRQY